MSRLTRALRAVFAPRVIYTREPSLGASTAIAGLDIERLYETQPHLRTVVSFLAANVAQLPLKCFVTDEDGVRVQDTSGVLPTLLAHPNADMTGYELIESLVASLKLYDSALWIVVRDANSDSGWQIRPVPISWVLDYRGGDAFSPEEVIIQNPRGGSITTVSASDCIIWHGWSPSDPAAGSSPVESLRMVLSEQISSWRYRRQQWDRSARTPAYISRPKDVEPWTDSALKRFKAAWAGQWEGENGSEAGGTPILEDGMELKASPSMDFKDAQWEEACQLSLETVCMVYRLNPSMIGADRSGMTYASVKENARQLYSETLGPDLRMIVDRLNSFLLPKIGVPANESVEFDLTVKLSSSFEEQVSAMQSSVGAPWLTRNEARTRMGYATLDGGDQLITPLNVIEGGLASPTDTTSDSYAAMYNSKDVNVAEPSGTIEEKDVTADSDDADTNDEQRPDNPSATFDVTLHDNHVAQMQDVLKRFFRRQRASVLSAIGAKKQKDGIKVGDPDWWNTDRWDRELRDDMLDVLLTITDDVATELAKALGIPDNVSPDNVRNYLITVASGKAHGINAATLKALIAAIDGFGTGEQSTPAGVFDYAENVRAGMLATSITTSITGWAATEAIDQSGEGDRVYKTWVVMSNNPRDSHARMNGETVPYDSRFSNGAEYPGDTGALDVDEVAGCTCELELTIY